MDWIRENKFLTGFFAVVLIGVIGLGYLLYSAMGRKSDVDTQYQDKAATLKQLESSAPYPAEENIQKYRDQKKTLDTQIAGLQERLKTMEFPVEPLIATQFQERLRASIAATPAKAKAAGVALPEEGLAMGFGGGREGRKHL